MLSQSVRTPSVRWTTVESALYAGTGMVLMSPTSVNKVWTAAKHA